MSQYFTLTDKEKEYLNLGENITQEWLSKYATQNSQAIYPHLKRKDYLRPPFSQDVDKIINCPLYNRYSDKTQVLSFFKNDNITRRASHVQYVSKIARTIGRALRLNLDLIEAISLGHDIGHTPFGHKGEQFLSECYQTGCIKRGRKERFFNHNVQSARYFRKLTANYDISLQTISGILAHNGEKVCKEYTPSVLTDFSEFDNILERCFLENGYHKTLRPNTLEGCVVRLSDMIAYVGKDRQDLYYAGMSQKLRQLKNSIIGNRNAEIVSNMITNIVKNSIESPSLNMDENVFNEFKAQVDENYELIYNDSNVVENYEKVHILMNKLYEELCDDLETKKTKSIVYKFHIKGMHLDAIYSAMGIEQNIDDIVTDFIACMTDDYFIDLCSYLHINDKLVAEIKYHEYFDQ